MLCAVLSSSVVSDTLRSHGLHPMGPQAPLSWGFSRQEYWSGLPCPPPGDPTNLGIEPRSTTLWVDSLPSEPPGNPKNARVGSLSLLQGIFPTQESSWGLLHCRWILYQLSYQGEINFGYNSHFYLFIFVQSFMKFRGNNSLTLLIISK